VRKVVVSRQRPEFTWRNSELIKGDLLDAVASLKADAGIRGILIPGSISVVQQLLAAGLVDELRLLVHPVAARKGRRLFDDGDAPYHLKVTATEVFPTGVIRVIYSPAQAPATAGYDEIKDHAPGGDSRHSIGLSLRYPLAVVCDHEPMPSRHMEWAVAGALAGWAAARLAALIVFGSPKRGPCHCCRSPRR